MKLLDTNHIEYTKTNESTTEITDRIIIPTSKPVSSYRAIDVTELNESEQDEMVQHVQSYDQYKKVFLKTMFSFEDWLDHTNQNVDVKWRSFSESKITET